MDARIMQVLSAGGKDDEWRGDFERFQRGDATLTRESAGEGGIRAVQRLMIFLGYSTSSTGAFIVDGDFGRGTNRGIAQYQFEQGLPTPVTRDQLCYPCTFGTAQKAIVAIPDVRLDPPTLDSMVRTAVSAIESHRVTCGRFEDALFHLNSLEQGRLLSCREILLRYGPAVDSAVSRVRDEKGVDIRREWVLSIIKQETGGVIRPRFEQHKLCSENARNPDTELSELRLRSMSIGLGQIMGFNSKRVGAASAREMLCSPVEDQVLYVARFIASRPDVVSQGAPQPEHFRSLAAFYNGPSFAAHHYHERLETWFREFRNLSG
jgi:hypothetical protein